MQGGALPDPGVLLLVVVAAVALPDHDVAVVQALEPAPRAGALDEARLRLARVFCFKRIVGGGVAVGPERGRGELAELVAVGLDEPEAVVLPFPFLLQLGAEPGHVLVVPGEVGEVVVEGQVEVLAADRHAAHGEAVVDGGAALEPGLEGVADGAEIAGARRLGPDGEHGEQPREQENEAALAHEALRILATSMTKVRMPARTIARQSARKSLMSS